MAKIYWAGQSCFQIEVSNSRDHSADIVIDPYDEATGLKLPNLSADILLVTHNHHDHLSIDDVAKIIQPTTIIVASSLCEDNLKDIHNKKMFLKQNVALTLDNFSVKTIPAYTIDKFRSP